MQRAHYQPLAAPVFYFGIFTIFGNFLIAVTKQPDIVIPRQCYGATEPIFLGNQPIWSGNARAHPG